MNRVQRRSLERKADALVARAFGVELPPQLDLARHVALICEGAPMLIVDRNVARDMLAAVGVDDLVDEAQAKRPPFNLTIIVFVGGFTTVVFSRLGLTNGERAVA